MGKRVATNTRFTALIVLISLLLGVFIGNLIFNGNTNTLQNEVNINLAEKSEQEEKIDINHASKAELMSLQGIGEKKAQEIISNRPYKDKWDLINKKILGKDTFNQNKSRLEVY